MFLVELAVVLLAAKAGGHLASRLGQPPVLGQLVAGLLIGLALSFFPVPAFQANDSQLTLMANLGVDLLMFLAGLETDWDQLLATGKAAFASATMGVVLPLIGGFAVAQAFGLPPLEGLFVGVILTATSVSITAQTLMELGSLQTIEGSTILGAAIVDDVIGLVAFSVAIVVTGAQDSNLLVLAVTLIAFFAVSMTLGARAVRWAMRRAQYLHGAEPALAIALAIAFAFGFVAQSAGLAAITGAYLAGLLINQFGEHTELTEKVKVLAYGFFVPVFLVKSGMDARVNNLGPLLAFVVAISLVAIATKILGCGLGAWLTGLTLRQSGVVGAGMIARGEVGLAVAGLASEAGLIPPIVFSATVVVVLVTVLATPPLLRLALNAHAQSAQEVERVSAG